MPRREWTAQDVAKAFVNHGAVHGDLLIQDLSIVGGDVMKMLAERCKTYSASSITFNSCTFTEVALAALNNDVIIALSSEHCPKIIFCDIDGIGHDMLETFANTMDTSGAKCTIRAIENVPDARKLDNTFSHSHQFILRAILRGGDIDINQVNDVIEAMGSDQSESLTIYNQLSKEALDRFVKAIYGGLSVGHIIFQRSDDGDIPSSTYVSLLIANGFLKSGSRATVTKLSFINQDLFDAVEEVEGVYDGDSKPMSWIARLIMESGIVREINFHGDQFGWNEISTLYAAIRTTKNVNGMTLNFEVQSLFDHMIDKLPSVYARSINVNISREIASSEDEGLPRPPAQLLKFPIAAMNDGLVSVRAVQQQDGVDARANWDGSSVLPLGVNSESTLEGAPVD